ncbi:hypothetical protein ACOSP7_016452 [Xanthoceras sorbifolium]
MTCTPSPGFRQVRNGINANSTSVPRKATPATLTSSARQRIFELKSAASDTNPEDSKGGLPLEPVAVNPAGQLHTESTVAPTVNPTPHGPT